MAGCASGVVAPPPTVYLDYDLTRQVLDLRVVNETHGEFNVVDHSGWGQPDWEASARLRSLITIGAVASGAGRSAISQPLQVGNTIPCASIHRGARGRNLVQTGFV
jgi:hypothetical protein